MSFDHQATIYRNYDIRGHFPDEISPEEVKKIGAAIVKRFAAKKVAVGRDNRPSADVLFDALAHGLLSEGCEVVDLGLITTPMSYYVCGSTDVDATVMITASHMPSNYNGLKITIEDGKPVVSDLLQELRGIVGAHTFSEVATAATVTQATPHQAWIDHFTQQHDYRDSGLSVVIDPANMVGVLEIDTFKALPGLTVYSICDELDHTCPHHEANPIKLETLHELGQAVRKKQADLGVAFDGDADRVGIVDEAGEPVPSDIVGALLCERVLEAYPGAPIVFDTRSSKAVPETITKLGGIPIEWKVGHTNIRTKMREEDAVLGIELAGHFFFKDTYFSEGGPLPALYLLDLIKQRQQPLSQLAAQLRKYYHSGEINSEISRPIDEIYRDLVATFPEAAASDLDGLKLVCDDWWCNVRPSANDPVLRLNAEADTPELLQKKVDTVLSIIRSK